MSFFYRVPKSRAQWRRNKGEAADCKSYDTLIDLPERAPNALVADKAYDSDAIRDDLKQRGIRAVIPPKSNRTKAIRYNKPPAERLICAGPVPGRFAAEPLRPVACHQCDSLSTVTKPSRCKHSSIASVVASSSPLSL
jgi:hypothetical protein